MERFPRLVSLALAVGLSACSATVPTAPSPVAARAAPGCSTGRVVDVDGTAYSTAGVGPQCWMAENLRTTRYRDGSSIALDDTGGASGLDGPELWSPRTTGARTVYANQPANLSIYGYLYNWHATADPRGLCPAGWHLPSDAEWATLVATLGANAGGKLRSAGTGLWLPPNTGATNESGFNALPGGIRSDRGGFDGIGVTANFWTTTWQRGQGAFGRLMVANQPDIGGDWHGERSGLSVRCLQD